MASTIIDGPKTLVVPGLMDVVSFEDLDLFGVTVNGWPPDSSFFQRMNVVAGRAISSRDGRVVMLGSVLAKNLPSPRGPLAPRLTRIAHGPGEFVTVCVAEFVRILAVSCCHGPTSHEVGYGPVRNAS